MPRGSQAFAIFVAGVLLLSPGLAAATTGHHPQLKIGVPLDTPSPSAWSAVIANAPTVGLVVFNPASGPGKAPDLVSASEVSDARETGIKVVGYVYTHYADGNVTLKQAESQVDDYLRWYQVDGIFFDQTNSSCTGSAIGYYSSLYEYVKSARPTLTVVLNPGTDPGPCYAAYSDVLLNFENSYPAYESYSPASWTSQKPSSAFFHLVLGAPDDGAMRHAVDEAASRNVGWIYVTNLDSNGDTYGTLPPYFGDEVAYVRGLDQAWGWPQSLLPLFVLAAAAVAGTLVALRRRLGTFLEARTANGQRTVLADSCIPPFTLARLGGAHRRADKGAEGPLAYRGAQFSPSDPSPRKGPPGAANKIRPGAVRAPPRKPCYLDRPSGSSRRPLR